jgi:hypothetical protein
MNFAAKRELQRKKLSKSQFLSTTSLSVKDKLLDRNGEKFLKALCSQLIDEPNRKAFYSWFHQSVGETFF